MSSIDALNTPLKFDPIVLTHPVYVKRVSRGSPVLSSKRASRGSPDFYESKHGKKERRQPQRVSLQSVCGETRSSFKQFTISLVNLMFLSKEFLFLNKEF